MEQTPPSPGPVSAFRVTHLLAKGPNLALAQLLALVELLDPLVQLLGKALVLHAGPPPAASSVLRQESARRRSQGGVLRGGPKAAKGRRRGREGRRRAEGRKRGGTNGQMPNRPPPQGAREPRPPSFFLRHHVMADADNHGIALFRFMSHVNRVIAPPSSRRTQLLQIELSSRAPPLLGRRKRGGSISGTAAQAAIAGLLVI